MSMVVEIIADVACPWCFIGKRRLDIALEIYRGDKHAEPRLIWRPYQLHPEVPPGGADRESFLTGKYGEAGARRIYSRVLAMGRQAGLVLDFSRMARQPNTLAAHSLVALAANYQRHSELVDLFFSALFIGGRDLSDVAVLLELAGTVGIPEKAARMTLASAEVRERIAADELETRKLAASGAPIFIFNNKIVITGAQESQTLLRAMLMSNGDAVAA